MSMNKSVGINAALNAFRILLSVVFPLITYPYAARILGVENLGLVNFTSSIVSYYVLLAGLGISTYAIREGSMIRDKKSAFCNFANQMFSINFWSSLFSLVLVILTIFLIPRFFSLRILMLVQSIVVVGNLLSVDWIYSIEEDYLFITIRSIVVHVIALVLLFVFVRNENDYIWYAATTVVSNAGVSVFNFIHASKYVNLRLVKRIDWLKHCKPILVIFASNVTATIYVNSDKTLLGFLTDTYNVGLYSVSVNVYTVLKAVFSAIMLAILPRLSNYIATNKTQDYHLLANKLAKCLLVLVIPCVLGVILTSKSIVLIVGDVEFIDAYISLSILVVALFFSVLAIFLTTVVLLPHKLESINLKASIISALINLVLNILILKYLKENGAALTTLVAELFMFVFEYVYARRYLKLSFSIKFFVSIIIGCIGIVISVLAIEQIVNIFWVSITLKILVSLIMYCFILLLFKNEMILELLNIVKQKILRK